MGILKKIGAMKGGKLAAVFSGSAAAALLILLIPFIVRGNHLVWAGDGAKQGLTFLEYLREVGWFRAIGSYDFRFGLGMDFLAATSFISLFDPFNVFAFILPFDIVWVYDVIIVLKFLAAGAAMFAYLRFRRVQGGYAVIFSLLYMLSGYVLYTFVRHLNLTSGVIYLPFMAMGAELVYRKKNPFVLTGSVFLCLLNSFYMFFFNSVFVVLYAFLYHAEVCRNEGRHYLKSLIPSLWRIAAFYLAAVFAAGFLLLPVVYAYLHAARGGSKGLAWFDIKNFLLELLSLISPAVGENYAALGMNLFLFILAIGAFLFARGKAFAYKVCTAVFAVGFFLPLFGYIMNIFNYSNNRWSYLLSFSLFSMLALQSDGWEGKTYTVAERRGIAKALCAYFGLIVLSGGIFLVMLLVQSDFSAGAKWGGGVFVAVAAAAVLGAAVWAFLPRSYLSDKRTQHGDTPPKILDNRAARALAKPSVLSVLSVPLALVLGLCYYIGYSAQHVGADIYRNSFSAEEAYVAEMNRTGFFRTDVQAENDWWSSFNNRSVNNGYMGTVLYDSMSTDSVYSFLAENQVYNPPRNLGMSGLDGRPALQSLLSVKYYYGTVGSFGFDKVEGFDSLYENTNYVPFGFMYENTVSKEYYDSLDPLLRQYAMLSAMVVEGEGTLSAVSTGVLLSLPLDTNGNEDKFTLNRDETVTFTVSGCADKEVYLRFNGAEEVSERTEFRVTGNGKTRTYRFTEYGSNMYSSDRTACISLGVCTENEISVTVSMTEGRGISFASVEARGYSISDYETAVNGLRQTSCLENVSWDGNVLKGNVSAENAGWIFFSVPYDAGWSVKIDGKPQALLRANASFMAAALSAGEHEVVLEYETPLLKEGIILSCVGVAAVVALAAVWAVSSIRKKMSASG